VPGPGSYDPLNTLNKDRTVAYKMSNSNNRGEFTAKEARALPGPG
jgi:hypothetical protein